MITPRYEEPICALSASGSITVYEPARRDLLVAIEVAVPSVAGVQDAGLGWCRLDGHRLDVLIATLTDARARLRENCQRQEREEGKSEETGRMPEAVDTPHPGSLPQGEREQSPSHGGEASA